MQRASQTSVPAPPAAAERTLIDIRPHPLFIILRSLGLLVLIIALASVARWLAAVFDVPAVARTAVNAGVGLIAAFLVWNLLVWAMRRYTLTTRRLIRTAGVLRRSTMEIPLDRIQHIQIYRALRERLFRLGTLGFNTAGTGSTEMVWFMIDRPDEHLEQIRAAIERATGRGREPTSPQQDSGRGAPESAESAPALHIRQADLPVIGLAGGIGSGKSEVAGILADIGCFVIDSDRQARAALDRPEICDQLIRWWGRGILKKSGEVDRSEVAKIVFADERERTRLEALVHPLVRARRNELITEALARSAVAAVVDAPLLFEAGVDRECDVVIFVDAARELRLQRVRQSRGWSEAELDRREQAQMPLEEKRRRSQFIISNTGDREALVRSAEQVLATIIGAKS